MGKFILIAVSFVLVSCTTGIGKKMSQSTIDEIQAGKGKLTRDEVRQKIGAEFPIWGPVNFLKGDRPERLLAS